MLDAGTVATELASDGCLSRRRLPLVSVFSGAGGLDEGFASEGFETIFAADSVEAAVNSFNHNFGEGVAAKIDLQKHSLNNIVEMVRQKAVQAGAAPVGLIGGPPCQGVSRANNYPGADDPRNALFARYINLVRALDKEFKLDFFLFENVPGLKSPRSQQYYRKLITQLGRSFVLSEAVLDAQDFGVAQVRRRLIIVGISKRLGEVKFAFPSPQSSAAETVRSMIGGLPEPVFFARGDGHKKSDLHVNHWTMMPKSKKFANGVPGNRDGRSFVRLDWDAPSRTVAYGNREIHVHPDGRRRLSIYEALRLQGFPKSFELLGNLSEQVTQISNAVPPPLAAALARSIADTIQAVRVEGASSGAVSAC